MPAVRPVIAVEASVLAVVANEPDFKAAVPVASNPAFTCAGVGAVAPEASIT